MRQEMLSFSSAGKQACREYHYFEGIRNVYIFHYIVSGKGTVIYGRKKHTVCAGQIFIVFPGIKMSYIPDKEDPYTYKWIDFNGTAAQMFIESTGFSVDTPVSPCLPEAEAFFDFYLNGTTTATARQATLVRLFSYLMEFFPAYSENTANDEFIFAQNYILTNLNRSNLTVEETAYEVGISRSGLFRLFIKNLGISPAQYIHEKRVENAKSMLKTKTPIKQIAFFCGYNDSSHFSRHFRKATGFSPSEYRKLCQSKTNN